ncbi:DUF1003 domain-containing protein [Neoactinobaculum massilliense]|uniref:DUF1003 domain-containing protein n=1 Tax=Neoactinobaculum massilliense TaxID=2364794 RepID=UPI000F52902A|nr:DUF1003 domain-containing protein [Neoactinobaculum massilliense]
MASELDKPLDRRSGLPLLRRRRKKDTDRGGRFAETIARFSGTPTFLLWLTIFVAIWIGWNSLAPAHLRFDSADLGFTALTLMLSLQASYSAPLILLAQNRQDARDRVQAENDRQQSARNLTDTEYLTREIAGMRMALGEVATRDYVRSELRDLLDEINRDRDEAIAEREQRISELEAELREARGEPRTLAN